MLSSFSGKHVLLLQGPMGPFFQRLSRDLEAAGARVSKINFCAGDTLFYPSGAITFRGSFEEWPDFIGKVILKKKIDTIFLFGDCRPYHYTLRNLARWLKVELFVFEEGYLRPDYITIERDGVNNHSAIPRDPSVYATADNSIVRNSEHKVGNSFSRAALYAMAYSLANALFSWRYPHYRHHRPLHPVQQSWAWVRGWFRKHWFLAKESKLLRPLTCDLSGRYFLVPLQVHNDAQVTTHSNYESVEAFIMEVTASFAQHGRPSDLIVFKHHPMDRAYRDYTNLLTQLAKEHGLEGRLFYVHDLHLPTLLKHARGTVVINSTVGLSSVHHGTPVITLGDPVYNMQGLAFQGTLEEFWHEPGSIDKRLYRGFRNWLLAHNQANGNFYRRITEAFNQTGVFWPLLGAEALAPAREETAHVIQVEPVNTLLQGLPVLPVLEKTGTAA